MKDYTGLLTPREQEHLLARDYLWLLLPVLGIALFMTAVTRRMENTLKKAIAEELTQMEHDIGAYDDDDDDDDFDYEGNSCWDNGCNEDEEDR